MTKKSKINLSCLILILAPILLFSCSEAHFVDNASRRYYAEHSPTVAKTKTPYFVFKTAFNNDKEMPENPTTSKTKLTKNLPLILYWDMRMNTYSSVNTFVPVNNLIASVNENAKATGLLQKLNGERIELTINSIPHEFNSFDKAQLYFLIIITNFYVEPQPSKLDITYRILNGDAEVKKGNITIDMDDQKQSLSLLKTRKRVYNDYFKHYDEAISAMGKTVVEKLNEEL